PTGAEAPPEAPRTGGVGDVTETPSGPPLADRIFGHPESRFRRFAAHVGDTVSKYHPLALLEKEVTPVADFLFGAPTASPDVSPAISPETPPTAISPEMFREFTTPDD